MAITSGFYNALNHDRQYEAVQVGSIFDGIIEDGIYETIGQKLMVTASGTGLVVNVGTGRAWFNHTWTLNDAILPIEMDEAELVLDRIDAVVLEVDASLSGRTNAVKTVKGVPSSNPVKPTLINNEEVHQYPLAYVSIKAEQTLVEQSDIENAVGTSATPFVIGVLEMMNVDALIAQWQTQFENIMRDDQQDFQNWEVLVKAAYETWFAGVREQMDQDIEEFENWETTTQEAFESWFQNLQDELDENQAAHLQRQIGNLNALETSAKSDLVSAINEVNGRITTSISEILIDYNESMVGVEITLSHTASAEGHTPESYTRTLVEPEPGMPYEIEVDVKNLGEWVISWTHEGQSYTETFDVHYYGYYHVVLHEGFTWREWVVAGGISILKHDSLASLLADEKDVRQLFTKHASVDYMVDKGTANSTECQTIIENDLCAKWINLNDYALDYLYTNVGIKSLMDTADKYFYGEWIYDGTSWGPKGNIPVMTSNTAPYGEVSASSVYSSSGYEAYRAFDNNDTTRWNTANLTTTNSWIMYKFTNPVCVRKFRLRPHYASSTCFVKNYRIEASNDGSTWETLYTGLLENIENDVTVDITNDDYYLYYRLYVVDSYNPQGISVYTLQFYGRELKVSVPTMTSNTAPYGEVIKSSEYNSTYAAYKAFDGDAASLWAEGASDVNAWIGYKFNRKVKLGKVRIIAKWTRIVSFSIQGSNDGVNFETINTPTTPSADDVDFVFDVDDENTYTVYRACVSKARASQSTMDVQIVQFYGKDYSEKEFTNDGFKWLYDHGVELEELQVNNPSMLTKNSDSFVIDDASTSLYGRVGCDYDLTGFNLFRGVLGNIANPMTEIIIQVVASLTTLNSDAFTRLAVGNNPYTALVVSTSSFNQTKFVGVSVASTQASATGKAEFTELWLE